MNARVGCCVLLATTACCARVVSDQPYVAELELRGVRNVDARALRKGLASKPVSRWRRGPATPFDELELARDRLRVLRYYEQNGYYAARVTLAEGRPRRDGGVDVVIAVEEGPPTLIGDVRVFGIADLDDKTKAKLEEAQLGLRRGQVFHHADYERYKASLLSILRRRGYPNARVTGVVDVLPSDNLANISVTVRPDAVPAIDASRGGP